MGREERGGRNGEGGERRAERGEWQEEEGETAIEEIYNNIAAAMCIIILYTCIYLSAVERLDSVFHLRLQVCRWAPAQSAWSSRAVQCTVCGEWAVGERWEERGTHAINYYYTTAPVFVLHGCVLSIYSHTLMMGPRVFWKGALGEAVFYSQLSVLREVRGRKRGLQCILGDSFKMW